MMSVHASADLDRRLAFTPTLYSLHMAITSIEYYTCFPVCKVTVSYEQAVRKFCFLDRFASTRIQTLYDYCIVWTSSATQCFKYNFNMYLMHITDHFPSCCGKQSNKYAFCQMLFRWGLWNCKDKCVCTGFINLDPFSKLTGDLNIKTKVLFCHSECELTESALLVLCVACALMCGSPRTARRRAAEASSKLKCSPLTQQLQPPEALDLPSFKNRAAAAEGWCHVFSQQSVCSPEPADEEILRLKFIHKTKWFCDYSTAHICVSSSHKGPHLCF